MAGSTMSAFKSTLVTELGGLASLSSVNVSYMDPGDSAKRENLWCGAIRDGEHAPVALKAGRRRREENYTAEVFIQVSGARLTAQKSEERALVIAQVLEEYLADNPKLDGTITGLLFAVVSGMEMTTVESSEGPYTTVKVEIDVKAQLL